MPPAHPSLAFAAMKQEGYCRVAQCVPSEMVESLAKFVDDYSTECLQKVESGEMEESVLFGKIHARENRLDVKLPLDEGSVKDVVSALLASPVGGLLEEALGEEAELVELSAIISDPGAKRQPVHWDTPSQQSVPLYSVFVALQDITEEMGPTVVLPTTHTQAAHEEVVEDYWGPWNKKTSDDTLLADYPHTACVASAGDALIIDSRLLHCGGANTSDQRRRLLVISFLSDATGEPPYGSTYSLRDEYKKKYHLSSFRDSVASSVQL